MEEGSDTAFWKDAHNTYRQDNSELTYSQNDFFRRVKVISLKERSSPSNYEKKYAFFLDDFGDVNASLYSLFEKIIHHKERKKSLSAFCI